MNQRTEHTPLTVAACIAGLHQTAPGTIGDLLQFQVLEENWERGICLLECRTEDWMRNSFGTLHGGMCATILDQAMGFLARSQADGEGITPTIQLQVNYHRPLIPGQKVLVKMWVVSKTHSLISMMSQASMADAPEKLCLTGTGTAFIKR